MIASNTKALTTLMLAKLVDEKKLTWDTPATTLLPSFKLGDADDDEQGAGQAPDLRVHRHAAPGPRVAVRVQGRRRRTSAMAVLGTMQPTSKFGELFQYSNPLAAAAGFVGGHVAYPEAGARRGLRRGDARAVFDPLGMTATTFDFAQAQHGNFATPHAPDVDGKPALAADRTNSRSCRCGRRAARGAP